jgi:hypothetical protein
MGNYQSTTEDQLQWFVSTTAVHGFDPALGVLQGIDFTLSSNVSVTGAITDTNPDTECTGAAGTGCQMGGDPANFQATSDVHLKLGSASNSAASIPLVSVIGNATDQTVSFSGMYSNGCVQTSNNTADCTTSGTEPAGQAGVSNGPLPTGYSASCTSDAACSTTAMISGSGGSSYALTGTTGTLQPGYTEGCAPDANNHDNAPPPCQNPVVPSSPLDLSSFFASAGCSGGSTADYGTNGCSGVPLTLGSFLEGGFDSTNSIRALIGGSNVTVTVTYDYATPEPATFLMFGSALVGIGLLRRRFVKK